MVASKFERFRKLAPFEDFINTDPINSKDITPTSRANTSRTSNSERSNVKNKNSATLSVKGSKNINVTRAGTQRVK